MLRWIRKVLGITSLINEQKKTNELLEKLIKECKRNSDLVEAYNRAYHVK